MKYEITYQLYNWNTGKPDGQNRGYECKDAADYARCVKLYKAGEIYLTTVNGHEITSQHYYPGRRLQEIERRKA